MALIGLATGDYTVIVAGFPFIIMPVLGIFVYGLLGKLGAIIYNNKNLAGWNWNLTICMKINPRLFSSMVDVRNHLKRSYSALYKCPSLFNRKDIYM